MRERRRWRGWSAGGSTALALLALTACALQPPGASGVPSTSAAVGPGASPGASESPPSPSTAIVCDSASAYLEPTGTFQVLAGTRFVVRVEGFPANTAVTLTLAPMDDSAATTPLGAITTDGQGKGVTAGVVPADARLGDMIVQALASEFCGAMTYLFVVASLQGIGIDDDTVAPGQQVTIRASGFLPESALGVFLDGDPGDLLCECRELASAQTNASGSVEVIVQIPDDVAPGQHIIVLAGAAPDAASDLSQSVAITVDR